MANPGATPAPSTDWTVQTADRIETVVSSVRDRTVGPLSTASRGLVYGLLAGALATVLMILLVIGTVRAAEVYLFDRGSQTGGTHVWLVEVTVGGILVLAGLFLWSKRKPRRRSTR
jgi:hypothetical protein